MTAVHFIHIGKTAGTAIKTAIKQAGRPKSKYGRVKLHPHRFRVTDVPRDDVMFFVVRDPVARFISGFYSRLRKGQPRYLIEWTPGEQAAFELFQTPQMLAGALASGDRGLRKAAEAAMHDIRHVRRRMSFWLGSPRALKRRESQIIFIVRQESLSEEWPLLKEALALPADLLLPTDSTGAHRGDPGDDRTLDDLALGALRRWYAQDYRLLELCERIRHERGWVPALARSVAD